MNQNGPIDTQALAEAAKASKHKETYLQLEKTPLYRIGVGARADVTDAAVFFLEVILVLPEANAGEVDLPVLENVIACLKTLHKRGYLLAYDDGHAVSGEKKNIPRLNAEYLTIKSLLETTFKKTQ
ncbi:MAG: hypothetical protein ACBZ72_11175 [Candidatus Bathyarchaeia archaeon]|jgi:hypothetical protein